MALAAIAPRCRLLEHVTAPSGLDLKQPQCIYLTYLFHNMRGGSVKTAKIFKHGNSQAVRLPKEFRFAGDEVQIKRSGAGVLLLPSKLSYEQIMSVLSGFKGRIARHKPKDQIRHWR